MPRHKHHRRTESEKKSFDGACKWSRAPYFGDGHCRLGYRSCSGKKRCISRKIKGRGFSWK